MKAAALYSGIQAPSTTNGGASTGGVPGQGESFANYLSKALQDVQNLQDQANASGTTMAQGQGDYVHNTVLAYEKANLALQLTIQVRDKIVEAFQELMRIQM
ncbi:MAG TPA: flagellar hook-basal body complex protein FliE [Syntrophomonadaceae bacterium]|nr:flagellar hook-basal body complex protein FliE [Syntrophomonadaceae bacterium]